MFGEKKGKNYIIRFSLRLQITPNFVISNRCVDDIDEIIKQAT